MNLEQLEAELASGRVRPVYLLAGAEPLLREDAVAAIRVAALDGAPPDFDLERLRGAEISAATLRDAIRTLPVLAARRVVQLIDPEAGRGAQARERVAALAEVVREAAGQDRMVLVVSAAKVDRRSRWVKAVQELAVLIDCDPPRRARDVASFAQREAKRQGVDLDGAAAALLAERVGAQLLLLRQEIAKAALLAGEGNGVTRECVDASTRAVAEKPIWDLTDAIGEGRTAQALEMLARMQRAGAPAPVILGTLASHFRKLARLKSGGAVAGPPFAVRRLESQVRRYSSPRLLACLQAIHSTDTAIKGAGVLPPALAVERLVLGLAS